ncbi:50S ribosome-binding GTPase [Acidothermaceae bacterium B102]|nr:50S ribosome-binding GTPase [Acidothermaceae bacterium B102]
MAGPGLRERISSLLADAGEAYAGTPWERRFQAEERHLEGALRVAIAGTVKAGKSTLLNALVGQPVAATDAGECTRVITEYIYGQRAEAWGVLAAEPGAVVQSPVLLDVAQTDVDLRIDLRSRRAEDFSRLLVTVPNPALIGLTVIDTPGMSSLTRQLGVNARRFLTGADDSADRPDAVLYLMRQLHLTDASFLEAFRDPVARDVPPVNALGILSRADEVGGGRDDALAMAASIASRYAREDQLRPYVQTVVPVAGLLATCASTLSESDYDDLSSLADLPASVTDGMLLSGDRFIAGRRFVPVAQDRRLQLMERLGLYGIRWALPELRSTGRLGLPAFRQQLADHSGLTHLREVLRAQILERRDVLKADAALRLVQRATSSTAVPGSARIASQSEKLRLGIADFQQLQLLNDLRQGALEADLATRAALERLLGSDGGSVAARLGAPASSSPDVLLGFVVEQHSQWRRVVSDVLTDPRLARAAAVAQKALEIMHRDLSNGMGGASTGDPHDVKEFPPASPSPPPAPVSGS